MPEPLAQHSAEYPLASIVIPNYNGARWLEACLRSVMALEYPRSRYEVLVVDNGSTDASAALVQQHFPEVHWIQHTVNNYCRALNVGAALARGEVLAFLNNDTRVDRRWLIELVTVLERDPQVGACGSKILLSDGRINSAGHRTLGDSYWTDRGFREADRGQYDEEEDLESLTSCALLVRRRAVDQVGLFDEDFQIYMEDVDLAHRLRGRGWRLRYVPASIVHHAFHGTMRARKAQYLAERNRLLYVAKHHPERLADALAGNGYWASPRQERGALLGVMPILLRKLINQHGLEGAVPVFHELFEQLRQIEGEREVQRQARMRTRARERAAAIEQRHAARVADLHAELARVTAELARVTEAHAQVASAHQQLASGLSRLYASETYRYLAKPLWRVLERLKRLRAQRPRPTAAVEGSPAAVMPAGPPTATGEILAGCTIISKNYLSHARVLCQSFLAHHPGCPFFVLLVDRLDGSFDPAKEPFQLVRLEDLRIPDLSRFCFQYTIVELNTAVKPYFLEYLFERYGIRHLCFLDPDILILRPLSHVRKLLELSAIVLIPHLTRPLEEDGCQPSELDILRAGAYNLGFIGLSDRPSTRVLLRWWQQRLYTHCEMAHEKGMHVDQRWIDLVPGFFEDVSILRHEGYDVAYWNLAHRPVTVRDQEVWAAGVPCHFFHFSGLDVERMSAISKHQSRFRLDQLGDASALFAHYRELLCRAGHEQTRRWPYAFDRFENGCRIPLAARKLYLRLGDRVRAFGDPFNTSLPSSYFNWLNEPVGARGRSEAAVTHLWHDIYAQRLDLQGRYPDVLGRDQADFVRWVADAGAKEHDVDEPLRPSPDALRGVGSRGVQGLVSRLYTRWLLPLEPWLKPRLRKALESRPRLWRGLQELRYRLIYRVTADQFADGDPGVHAPRPFGVNVLGYLASEKGTGESARSSIRALRAAGIPHVASNLIDPGSVRRGARARTPRNPYRINLTHVNADMVPATAHAVTAAYFLGRYNIGYWAWELPDFPEEWRSSCRYFDEIWVPSEFVRSAVRRIAPIPVVRIPHTVAVDGASGAVTNGRARERREGRVRFLFMFDFMSIWQRKNPFEVIEAFRRAFAADDEAELTIKTMHADFAPGAFRALQEASQRLPVTVADGVWSRTETLGLLTACDSFISLHRSEGFGLCLAEAMALGKPVIATAYSGNMDFMAADNSLPVRFRLTELTDDYGPYRRGSRWAEPDLDHAAELMRWVVQHPVEARELGQRAAQSVRRLLSAEAVGALMQARLQAVIASRGLHGPVTTQANTEVSGKPLEILPVLAPSAQ